MFSRLARLAQEQVRAQVSALEQFEPAAFVPEQALALRQLEVQHAAPALERVSVRAWWRATVLRGPVQALGPVFPDPEEPARALPFPVRAWKKSV